jgi:predicted nucleotidyltransferase
MESHDPQMPQHHQYVMDRFIAACRADERVVAAFLGGSYAAGTADAYSDLDLCLITTDEMYDDFWGERHAFVRLLGEPIFLEDYSARGVDTVFFFLADGTEAELTLGRESGFAHIHGGPHRVLLDKKGILEGAVFPLHRTDQAEQVEVLRGLVTEFWHDLCHHVITPLARDQLWSAFGGLEDVRRACVNLARLRADFSTEPEGYEKVEHALPMDQLAPLQATCCPLERDALLQAALGIVRFYRELAPPLAAAHGIPYPAALDCMMQDRLEQLSNAPARRGG